MLLIVLLVPMLIIACVIRLSSKGSVLFWQDRIGRDNRVFKMPKFRTMRIDTPAIATHLLDNPDSYLIPLGGLLRKFSLDELPQLWSVLLGDMSLVGPRPALYNQYDLIERRTARGVHMLVPGITGWAQVNGRDSIPISAKVEYDEYYFKNQSFSLDIKILLMTVGKVLRTEGVAH